MGLREAVELIGRDLDGVAPFVDAALEGDLQRDEAGAQPFELGTHPGVHLLACA